MSNEDTRQAAAPPPNRGSKPMGWRVVSKANTTEASSAREAPAKMAAMPTSAAMRTSTPSPGTSHTANAPSAEPSPPPMVKRGASVPPEVPLPSAMDHEMNFSRQKTSAAVPTRWPEMMASMLV